MVYECSLEMRGFVLPSPLGWARAGVMMKDSMKTSHSYQAKEVIALTQGALPVVRTGAVPEYKGVNEDVVLGWVICFHRWETLKQPFNSKSPIRFAE